MKSLHAVCRWLSASEPEQFHNNPTSYLLNTIGLMILTRPCVLQAITTLTFQLAECNDYSLDLNNFQSDNPFGYLLNDNETESEDSDKRSHGENHQR